MNRNEIKNDDIHHLITHMFKNRTRYKPYISYQDITLDAFTSLFGPLKFFCMAILKIPALCVCKVKKDSEKYKEA